MPTLTPEQIAYAKREKQRYLLSFLLVVCASGLSVLNAQVRAVPPAVAQGPCYAAALWMTIMTWRLCRSIRVGLPWTLIATVLAPCFGVFELIVVLRVYARRTGVKLSFVMGDREPGRASA